MESDKRVVSQMPLREIWNEHGVVSTSKLRDLNASEITGLLRAGQVRFVVADIGCPLKWVPPDECYQFWKSEAKRHLADQAAESYLESFPDSHCYIASEWQSEEGEPVILLMRSH